MSIAPPNCRPDQPAHCLDLLGFAATFSVLQYCTSSHSRWLVSVLLHYSYNTLYQKATRHSCAHLQQRSRIYLILLLILSDRSFLSTLVIPTTNFVAASSLQWATPAVPLLLHQPCASLSSAPRALRLINLSTFQGSAWLLLEIATGILSGSRDPFSISTKLCESRQLCGLSSRLSSNQFTRHQQRRRNLIALYRDV